MESVKQTRNTPRRDVDAELGRRAHILMWDQRMKQLELAGMMGISSESLGRKLKGRTGWSLAEIMDAASALGTTVAYLVGEAENPQPGGPAGGSGDAVHPLGLEPRTHWFTGTPVEDQQADREEDAIVTPLRSRSEAATASENGAA